MSALDPATARRLHSALALVSSPNDGEKLAAVAAVERLLARNNLTFSDLVAGAEPIAPAPVSRAERCRPPKPWAMNETDHMRLAKELLQVWPGWSRADRDFLRRQANRPAPDSGERDRLEHLRASMGRQA